MDPRTFLPPRTLDVASPPEPGDRARPLPPPSKGQPALQGGRPTVVAFLRHTGCPFAELTMHRLRDASAAWPEIQWIAISHAPPQATERWREAVGGAGEVHVLSDPSRRAYAEWGLGRTSLGHFLGRRSLRGVAGLARQGIRNRHPHGTRWQAAGTFAVDARGIVRWRHLPAHAGDVPELEPAVEALR
ncbi:MAG: AhpC/TSA family protein [Solirubrobacteraceae bacterium]